MRQLILWGWLSFMAGFVFAPFFALAMVLWVCGFVVLLGEAGEAIDAWCGGRVTYAAHTAPTPRRRLAAKNWPLATGWKRAQLKRRGQMLL